MVAAKLGPHILWIEVEIVYFIASLTMIIMERVNIRESSLGCVLSTVLYCMSRVFLIYLDI